MAVFKKEEIYNVRQSRNRYKYKKNFDTREEKLFRLLIQPDTQDYFAKKNVMILFYYFKISPVGLE